MDEVRPAATLIVARSGRTGVEVLVERRSEASRFAPGFVVFPGGTVDPADEKLALAVFADAGESARVAALRELYEETALLVTAGGLRALPGGAPFGEVAAVAPPASAALVEIGRWLAPAFLEVRFDAVFFAVEAAEGVDPIPDGIEIAEAWWARPSAIVEASADGDARLMWPTLVTLEALDACRSVDEVLSLRVPQEDPPQPGEQPRRGHWQRPGGRRA